MSKPETMSDKRFVIYLYLLFVIAPPIMIFAWWDWHTDPPNTYSCTQYKYDVHAKECEFSAPINTSLVLDPIEPGKWQGYRITECHMLLVTLDKATGYVTRSTEWTERGCDALPDMKAKYRAR